jgi:hypothetical protein
LAYRIVQAQNGAAALRWLGESRHTADNLVAAFGDAAERGAAADAKAFLEEELADGPRPVQDLERAARQVGIASRTLQRARQDLGIQKRKVGFGKKGYWMMELPKDADEPAKVANIPDLAVLGQNDAVTPCETTGLLRPPTDPSYGGLRDDYERVEREAMQDEDS